MVHLFFFNGGWAVFQFAAGRRQHLQTVGADGAARGCCPAGVSIAVSEGPSMYSIEFPTIFSRGNCGTSIVQPPWEWQEVHGFA